MRPRILPDLARLLQQSPEILQHPLHSLPTPSSFNLERLLQHLIGSALVVLFHMPPIAILTADRNALGRDADRADVVVVFVAVSVRIEVLVALVSGAGSFLARHEKEAGSLDCSELKLQDEEARR